MAWNCQSRYARVVFASSASAQKSLQKSRQTIGETEVVVKIFKKPAGRGRGGNKSSRRRRRREREEDMIDINSFYLPAEILDDKLSYEEKFRKLYFYHESRLADKSMHIWGLNDIIFEYESKLALAEYEIENKHTRGGVDVGLLKTILDDSLDCPWNEAVRHEKVEKAKAHLRKRNLPESADEFHLNTEAEGRGFDDLDVAIGRCQVGPDPGDEGYMHETDVKRVFIMPPTCSKQIMDYYQSDVFERKFQPFSIQNTMVLCKPCADAFYKMEWFLKADPLPDEQINEGPFRYRVVPLYRESRRSVMWRSCEPKTRFIEFKHRPYSQVINQHAKRATNLARAFQYRLPAEEEPKF